MIINKITNEFKHKITNEFKHKITNEFKHKITKKFIKDQVLITSKFFICLGLIESSRVFDYENENLMRRVVHMYRRIDQMSYKSKLKPYAESLKNMLDETDLKIMCKYKLNTDLDFSVRSRKNIISTPVILNNDSSIGEIINKIQSKYENKIGKKLYILNQPTIYKYIGNRAKHLWHVDPCNKDTIYNSITCIKKIGNISPLQYKDKNGDIHSIHFNEGDAALFNGGVTVHQVPQSKDANSERTVLSIVFIVFVIFIIKTFFSGPYA